MTGRARPTRAAGDRSSADRGLGTLPAQAWTIQPPSADERARARTVLAAFSRDGDELRELLDMLDLWPDATEVTTYRRARARRATPTQEETAC